MQPHTEAREEDLFCLKKWSMMLLRSSLLEAPAPNSNTKCSDLNMYALTEVHTMEINLQGIKKYGIWGCLCYEASTAKNRINYHKEALKELVRPFDSLLKRTHWNHHLWDGIDFRGVKNKLLLFINYSSECIFLYSISSALENRKTLLWFWDKQQLLE